MATTTNYSWTTPDDTALVKDGASAIRALGTAIDTSMNTALGTKKAGMVLLSTTSFSAVSSVSFPTNTFTATYNAYKFIFDITASTALNVTGRLRAAGTDNSSTIYGSTTWQGSSSVTASGSASATSWSAIGQAYDANMQRNIVQLMLLNPQVSTRYTYGHSIFIGDIAATPYPQQVYLGTNVTTSFDSITFGTNTGTISGSISCYGFNE